MPEDAPSARFERLTELDATAPTLVEGLPGLGLVASIAVDQITTQLGLEHHGTIRSDAFPPVAAFNDGRVRDAVRVYGGASPPVMTLQSEVPIPQDAVPALSRCVLSDLAEEFERAVFLAGAPAESEDQIGDVVGIATDDELESALTDAGIDLAEGTGAIGGVTGGLLADCYHADVPSAVLVVRCNPYIPDPGAAQAVIEDALEPLVRFDVDTTELEERAEGIRRQMRQVAQQLQEYQESQSQPPAGPSMYQ